METNSLKSGKCPKCTSGEVYTTHNITKRGERMIIPVTGFKRIFLDYYMSISCGYFEEYVPQDDLKDEKLMNKLKENWERVGR